MTNFQCPLCRQPVSRTLYEEITGIWKEREQKLKVLRTREKLLAKKLAEADKRFEVEKKRLQQTHRTHLAKAKETQKQAFYKKLQRQDEQNQKKMEQVERQFERQLTLTTTRILNEEHRKQKERQRLLKERLEKSAKAKLARAQNKLQRERRALEKKQRLQKDRHEKLLKQYNAFQAKKEKELGSAQKKIAMLEEQVRKGQSPQMLGLLDEKRFLAELKKDFPIDRFEHTGKGGDIVHYVYDRSYRAGSIVYELKKVSRFNNSHIVQAQRAKSLRQADYGILVTNAKRSRQDSGFFTARGIIIIHPAAALVLISILRTNLIEIARLKLGREERDRAIKAVMEYIQGPQFKNCIGDIIQDTTDLYEHLKKEVVDHMRSWQRRLEKYRGINSNANKIDSRVIKLLISKDERKQLPRAVTMLPIALPEKIK